MCNHFENSIGIIRKEIAPDLLTTINQVRRKHKKKAKGRQHARPATSKKKHERIS